MKLILKRLACEVDVTTLSDTHAQYVASPSDQYAPFALHTDDGTVLPKQLSTTLHSEPGEPVRLTVVFMVDGDRLKVEGHGL